MPRFAPYGWVRGEKNVYIPLPAGTTAAEIVTDWVGGFDYLIESAKAYVADVGVGIGASRTLRVLKGASTVAATGTVTEAGTATLGAETALTVTAANAEFSDSDKLTVDFASGGTAFTAGALNLCIVYRQRPQRAA